MNNFLCTFNEENVLTSLRDPLDRQWQTNFLLSFGNMKGTGPLRITRGCAEDAEGLLFHITLTNPSDSPVTCDAAGLILEANTAIVRDQKITYYERVMQQACTCGNSAFVYWHRASAEGRFLAMIALGDTSLCEELNEKPFALRVTPFTLGPGAQKTLSFRFAWMEDHAGIEELLYRFGGVALKAEPGLVIPEDMEMRLFLRSTLPIHGLSCDHTEFTEERPGFWKVRFTSFGEKNIVIHYGPGLETTLLCYATRPLRQLIDGNAAHIVKYQQYKGPAWYDGMFSQWSLTEKRMSTPDDHMSLWLYAVSADDPGICKAPYVAEKNISRPDPEEIAALEYYIEHFLWGGLQRTDHEDPYAWGVIGSDTWKENRESSMSWGTAQGQERMWRTFDYTHLIQLYYNMYRIAKAYPQYVHYLDADGYLYRAVHTALAFFEIPYQIFMREPWDFRGFSDWAFKQGNFHELYILPLLEACNNEKLRYYWETKSKYMIYDNPLPYGSEMWFDSTAFESTQAVAHYAVEHGLKPDVNGWYDKNRFGPGQGGWRSHTEVSEARNRDFMERQMAANLACRGTHMRDYTLQGSDYRRFGFKNYRLSYMSQMGGAAVLDYGLYFAEDPAEYVRIGYTSLLSSWALVNLGKDDPFYPDERNDGSVGWGFQPEPVPHDRCIDNSGCKRGPLVFDGEIQSGLSGAVFAACSVLTEDPDFGTLCYGGQMTREDGAWVIRPNDGIRRRFHDVRNPARRLHLETDRDAIREIRQEGDRLSLVIENVTGDAHETEIRLNGETQKVSLQNPLTSVILKLQNS